MLIDRLTGKGFQPTCPRILGTTDRSCQTKFRPNSRCAIGAPAAAAQRFSIRGRSVLLHSIDGAAQRIVDPGLLALRLEACDDVGKSPLGGVCALRARIIRRRVAFGSCSEVGGVLGSMRRACCCRSVGGHTAAEFNGLARASVMRAVTSLPFRQFTRYSPSNGVRTMPSARG
jgi:hypothetical protein